MLSQPLENVFLREFWNEVGRIMGVERMMTVYAFVFGENWQGLPILPQQAP